ncbi:hypothetical protein [Agromyces bauzanensis]
MIAAATCCRFVDTGVARPRVVEEFAADVRVERAVFAASPRVAAAFDDAALDAAVRFDGADSSVASAAEAALGEAALFEAAPFAAAPFAAVERGVLAARAGLPALESFALGAGRAADDPRSADTPVPVPSGASSW